LKEEIKIDLSDIHYYTKVTLKALLKVLWDESLFNHHGLVLDTISCILGSLKTMTSNFLYMMIPVITRVFYKTRFEFKEKTLSVIEKIIKHCGNKFGAEYIEPIVELFLDQCENHRYMTMCFDILLNLINFCKKLLRHKIEPIIIKINKQISNYEGS
jgi:FKBP12-rapamycin complex-associated protein